MRALLLVVALLFIGCHPCVRGHYEPQWREAYDDTVIIYSYCGEGCTFPIITGGWHPAHWEDVWVCDEYKQ